MNMFHDNLEYSLLTRTLDFNLFFTDLLPLYIKRLFSVNQFTKKAANELVGELDKELQERIIGYLRSKFNAECIVSEEIQNSWPPITDSFWIIDPLDGTHNFLMGLPLFGTMIAQVIDGHVVFSVIFLPCEAVLEASLLQYDPIFSSGLYFAESKKGTWRYTNQRLERLHVSSVSSISEAVVLLEGASRRGKNNFVLEVVGKTVRNRQSLSSSCAVVKIASGGNSNVSADVLISLGNKPWDNLPGCLLVEEAGGRVTSLDGEKWSLSNCKDLVFANKQLHQEVMQLIKGGKHEL